jgi:hypothetical protein
MKNENEIEITIDMNQGLTRNDEQFGYVHCGDGGYFFVWRSSLEETLESLDQDPEADEPEIGYTDVKEFLRAAIADKLTLHRREM